MKGIYYIINRVLWFRQTATPSLSYFPDFSFFSTFLTTKNGASTSSAVVVVIPADVTHITSSRSFYFFLFVCFLYFFPSKRAGHHRRRRLQQRANVRCSLPSEPSLVVSKPAQSTAASSAAFKSVKRVCLEEQIRPKECRLMSETLANWIFYQLSPPDSAKRQFSTLLEFESEEPILDGNKVVNILSTKSGSK